MKNAAAQGIARRPVRNLRQLAALQSGGVPASARPGVPTAGIGSTMRTRRIPIHPPTVRRRSLQGYRYPLGQAATANLILFRSGNLFSYRQGVLKSLLAAAPFASLVGFRSLSLTLRFSLLDSFADFSFMLLLVRSSGLYFPPHRGIPRCDEIQRPKNLSYRNTYSTNATEHFTQRHFCSGST
jgi:hypothetical protein